MSCPDCFKGAVHNHGTAQGHFETLHGYKTYIAGDPNRTKTSKSTILYLPDAFGVNLINNRLLADRYANETGCKVLLPDIIPGGGAPIAAMNSLDIVMKPAGYNPTAWLLRVWNVIKTLYYFVPFMIKAGPPKAYPSILRYARAVHNDLPPNGKLGVAGFCWGGYGSTNLCVETATETGSTRLIDAQFCAHPSGLKAPDMPVAAISKFRVPYSCAVAEKDFLFGPQPAEETEAVLRREVGPPEESDYEFVVHKGCGHSFAVRASPDNKVEFQGLEDAAAQAVSWFNRFLN